MRSITATWAALLLVRAVSAQTPVGFVPEVKDKLEIIFGTKAVETPGASVAKADAAKQPTLGTSDGPLTGASYLWIMMDLDVPSNFQNPSSPGPRRTNLHALITGFTPSTSATTVSTASAEIYALAAPPGAAGGPVAYVGPAPPAESPPHAHRYVSLLYETARNFTVARAQVGQTLGFDLAAFASKAGLGVPVRAGYFNVTG